MLAFFLLVASCPSFLDFSDSLFVEILLLRTSFCSIRDLRREKGYGLLGWRDGKRAHTCNISFRTLGIPEKNCRANIRPTTPKLPAVMPLFFGFCQHCFLLFSFLARGFVSLHWYWRVARWRTHGSVILRAVYRGGERGLKMYCFLTISTILPARCRRCWAGFCICGVGWR